MRNFLAVWFGTVFVAAALVFLPPATAAAAESCGVLGQFCRPPSCGVLGLFCPPPDCGVLGQFCAERHR